MPDIDKLFIKLVESKKPKGLMYVANKLGHDDTSRVKRWFNSEVPQSHKFAVMKLLKEEGLL